MSQPSSRIQSMDLLRGVAVMGILWMNIIAFALPQGAYFNPRVAGALSAGDIAFWLVSLIFFDGKMRALFSMLFGASMLLLIDREELAGRDGRRAQTIRATWLFMIGLAHYLLLWRGDILMNYAVVGCIALLFVGREPLSLVKWAFLFFLIHFLICAAFIISLHGWAAAAGAPDATVGVRDAFAAYAGSFSNPDDPAVRTEIGIYRAGFGSILGHHLSTFPGEWLWTFLFACFDTLGFMLLGMAMLKSGFLTARWQPDQYRRTARHCFLIGIAPMAALAIWIASSGFAPLPALGTGLAWSFPFRIPLAVGWAALILWIFTLRRDHLLVERVAAVGRLALSNYLGTSLVMCAIFYGWGLGRFAHVSLAALPLFVLGAWAGMLLWSAWWNRRFALGPAEWLWRSLYRGQAQKIRKSS